MSCLVLAGAIAEALSEKNRQKYFKPQRYIFNLELPETNLIAVSYLNNQN